METTPNEFLKRFHNRFSPNLSFDDPQLFLILVKELSKKNNKVDQS